MKFKTTGKAVKEGFSKVYRADYCELDAILSHTNAIAYASGMYGWNYDVYDVGSDIAVCTGYRSMPGQRIPCAAMELAKQAKSVAYAYDKPYRKRFDAVEDLYSRFVDILAKEGIEQ